MNSIGLTCHTLYGKGFGNKDAEIIVVGISPGTQEQKQGRPFVGPSGKLLDSCLKTVGLDREEIWATNLICWTKKDPDEKDIAKCKDRLSEEILGLKNRKVILAIGVEPVQRFIPNYPASKTRGIAMWSEEFNCWIIGTWHPSFILQMQSESLARDFLEDLKKAAWYCDKNREYGKVSYTVLDRAREVNDWLRERNTEDYISLDVETSIRTGKLRCFAMAQGDNCIVVRADKLFGEIHWDFFKRLNWTFQNGMFDVRVMWNNYGVELPIRHDTMYMSYMLDERAGEGDENYDVGVGIHGLKKLAGAWCGSGLYDIKTDDSDDETLWKYNAKDAVYTYRLAHILWDKMVQDEVVRPYEELLIPAANIAWRAKRRGMYVNKHRLQMLGGFWMLKWNALQTKLIQMAKDAGWPEEKFNPNSHPQLNKFLYGTLGLEVGDGGQNTRKKTLEDYKGKNEFVDVLLEWRGINKDITTYVWKVEEAIDENGYIHPDPVLHATVTGRWAYKNPPMQTIPQARNVGAERAMLRSLFTVESEDRELIEGDYSQSEVWWAAQYGQDENMFRDLRSGDFHGGVTKRVFKIEKEGTEEVVWEKKRNDSKYVTFGIAFGRQAPALHRAEMSEYPIEEVRQFVRDWLIEYGGYARWRERQQAEIREKGEQESFSGRKRRYPLIFNYHAFNQAMNFPVQCVSHDNLMRTYIELFDELRERWDAWIILEIHDALVIDSPKKWRREVIGRIKEVAEKNRYGVSVPMEFKVGDNLMQMAKYEIGA